MVFSFRKWSSNNSCSSSQIAPQSLSNQIATAPPKSPPVDNSSHTVDVTDGEWSYDPNEPRYCLCNQVSYGDMVACDNEDVSFLFCFKFIDLY